MVTDKPISKCPSCLWFDGDQKEGRCRRYPPTFRPGDSESRFPWVKSYDWCAEHSLRRADSP